MRSTKNKNSTPGLQGLKIRHTPLWPTLLEKSISEPLSEPFRSYAFLLRNTLAWILLSLLATPFYSLGAESVDLRWKEVQGSSGYLIRIQSEDGSVSERRIGTNSVRLDLDPGNYVIRIAGLNKFGKPGPFSDPAAIEIEETEGTRTIQMEEAQKDTANASRGGQEDPSAEKKADEPDQTSETDKQLPQTAFQSHPFYEILLPGWVQRKRGSQYQLYLYNGLLVAHAYAGFREKQRGDQLAREPWNDPTNILLLSGSNNTALSALWFRRQSEQSRYNEAQNNQRYIALSAILLYAWHFAELYFFHGDDSESSTGAVETSLTLQAGDFPSGASASSFGPLMTGLDSHPWSDSHSMVSRQNRDFYGARSPGIRNPRPLVVPAGLASHASPIPGGVAPWEARIMWRLRF